MRAPPTLAPARAAVSVKTEVRICLLSRRIRGTHQMRCAARRTHAKLRACDHGAMEDSLRRHAVQSILREQEWVRRGRYGEPAISSRRLLVVGDNGRILLAPRRTALLLPDSE